MLSYQQDIHKGDYESQPQDTIKVQYTVKGIDRETIRMMREAARQEGMKIGAWVSSRLRAAAERSFATPESDGAGDELVTNLVNLIAAHQEQSDQRLRRIETELLEITSSQRTILNKVICKLDM